MSQYGNAPPPYTPYSPGSQPAVAAVHIVTPSAPLVFGAAPPAYGSVPYRAPPPAAAPPQIIIVGACPACRIGMLRDDYSLLGILCAILFFPVGILCCLGLKNRYCTNCGAEFS